MRAGADAVTLADHATGDLIRAEMYRDFLWPLHKELAKALRCPLILHICGDTADRIPFISRSGLACFHFESKVSPAKARWLAQDRIALMGNINNPRTLLAGTRTTSPPRSRNACARALRSSRRSARCR